MTSPSKLLDLGSGGGSFVNVCNENGFNAVGLDGSKDSIDFEKDDFAIEVELIAKVLSKTNKYKEIPISYKGRSYKEGKKIKLVDGFKYILAIFRYK